MANREERMAAATALATLYKVLGQDRAFNRLVENQLDQIKYALVEHGWFDGDLNVPYFDDMSHRYAPTEVWVAGRGAARPALRPVQRYIFHPAGTHVESPIQDGIGTLECVTDFGSRWFGCDRAYINAELRMVVVGHNPRDEVRARWELVPEDLRVHEEDAGKDPMNKRT